MAEDSTGTSISAATPTPPTATASIDPELATGKLPEPSFETINSAAPPVEHQPGRPSSYQAAPSSPQPSVGSDEEITIDDTFEEDGDSAYDSGSLQSDTTSLLSHITKYRYENNRRYHAYKDGEYWGPNDEQQSNQLDIAHHLFLLTMGDRLFLAPIGDNPQNVLDIGTGTGIWAMDFADQYPSARVTGFDLSPIQPQWVAPNLRFEINDACDPDWGYSKNSFDFIHVRAMYGSVADWPAFYQQVLDNLVPGGWYQQLEMSVVLKSDDGSVKEGSIFDQWGKVSLEAGDKFGKDLRIHEQIKGYVTDAGFVDIVETVYRYPVGPWAKDPFTKSVGEWNRIHWQEGIEGWSMALLTRVLNWSYTEVQAYLGKMREALKDNSIHAYHIVGTKKRRIRTETAEMRRYKAHRHKHRQLNSSPRSEIRWYHRTEEIERERHKSRFNETFRLRAPMTELGDPTRKDIAQLRDCATL